MRRALRSECVGDHAGKIDALGRAEIADIRVVQRLDELQHLTITADMFAAAPLIELAHAVDADMFCRMCWMMVCAFSASFACTG